MKTGAARDPNPCRPRHFRPPPCGPAPQEGPAKQSLETSHTRLIITGALICLAYVVIAARLIEVAGFKVGDPRQTHNQAATEVATSRADIVDRNGVLLATTLATPSLYANPKAVIDSRGAAHQLVQVLPDLNEGEVFAKLTSDKSFVWLKRQLTPRQQDAVNRLGIPGLEFQDEDKRIYPDGNTLAHVVGYTGIDNKGLAGIERGFDDVLRGRHEPLALAIDLRVQAILRDEIARRHDRVHGHRRQRHHHEREHRRGAGAGLAARFRPQRSWRLAARQISSTGLRSAPTRSARCSRSSPRRWRSIYRVTTMTGGYDATHPIQIGRFTIHDDHAQGRWLIVPEIFMYSSNIGAAKMALDVGAERQRDFLGKLGLLKAPSFELPEIAAPSCPIDVAADQYHDHRLRPWHLGEPAADRDAPSAPSSMAACCGPPRC